MTPRAALVGVAVVIVVIASISLWDSDEKVPETQSASKAPAAADANRKSESGESPRTETATRAEVSQERYLDWLARECGVADLLGPNPPEAFLSKQKKVFLGHLETHLEKAADLIDALEARGELSDSERKDLAHANLWARHNEVIVRALEEGNYWSFSSDVPWGDKLLAYRRRTPGFIEHRLLHPFEQDGQSYSVVIPVETGRVDGLGSLVRAERAAVPLAVIESFNTLPEPARRAFWQDLEDPQEAGATSEIPVGNRLSPVGVLPKNTILKSDTLTLARREK